MMAAGAAAWLCLLARAPEGYSTGTFTMYRSTQPPLAVAFEYPADWEAEESSGTAEQYSQVQLYAPASLEARLRVYMVVRAVPSKDAGGRYADVAEMVAEYRTHAMPSLRIQDEEPAIVAGSPATVLKISGTVLLPWHSPNAQPVPVNSQRVFFEKNGSLYELGWMATPTAAPRTQAAFARLLETLTIQ